MSVSGSSRDLRSESTSLVGLASISFPNTHKATLHLDALNLDGAGGGVSSVSIHLHRRRPIEPARGKRAWEGRNERERFGEELALGLDRT